MEYQDYIRQTPEGYIRVVSSADYDSIVSYTPIPDIVVYTDAVVNLPNTVQTTFKSGKVETMVIKWERVNVDTSTAGTQKIYGDIGNGAAAVLQNVIVNELSDLDILRQIRDANPTSDLPLSWLDSEDPYTQWSEVTWTPINGVKRCTALFIQFMKITNLQGINKLTYLFNLGCYSNKLTSLDVSGMQNLLSIYCTNMTTFTNINLTNTPSLSSLILYSNSINSIPTLTERGSIITADFSNNKFDSTEVARLLSIGFTAQEIGTQNP